MLEQSRSMFRHVDVDVHQSAIDICECTWCRRLSGATAFDGHGTESCAGIARGVVEQREMDDRFAIHDLNDHAITIKTR